MFRLKPNPTFRAPVPLSQPGVEKPIEITVEFRHKTATGVQAWMARAPGRADVDVLDEVIASWDGVMNEAGEQVPYSRGALTDMLENYPTSQGELFAAYLREMTKAKAKN